MTSPWAAAAQAADAALDGAFAERVRIEPQAAGEYATTDDPERPPLVVRAVLTYASDFIRAQGAMRSDPGLPSIANEAVRISVREAVLNGASIRQNDRVLMLDRPNEHALMIHSIESDGVGRLLLRCVRAPR